MVFKRGRSGNLSLYRGGPALRYFLRAVGGNLVHAVQQKRVAKTGNQGIAVIGPVASAQVRRDLSAHEAFNKRAQVRCTNAIRYHGAARDGPHQGHGRVAAVEHAQFGFFVTVYIGGHAHACPFQQGGIAGVGKVVFNDPFPKGLGAQCAVVLHTQCCVGGCQNFRGGRGHDAVDHAARKGATRVHPLQEGCVLGRGRRFHQGL